MQMATLSGTRSDRNANFPCGKRLSPGGGVRRGWLLALMLAIVAGVGGGCTRQAKINRHLARAERYIKAEEFEKADIECRVVLQADPRNAVAMRQLGLVYYNEGRPQQAYSCLRKAVELNPADAAARLKLGVIELSFHMPKEARETAMRVLEKQPENEEALMLLAETASTNNAREVVKRIEQLPAAVRNGVRCHIALGELAGLQQDLAGAEREFKAAAAADPKSSEAQVALGSLHLARRETALAEECFKRAAELAPLRSPLRLRYADLRMRSGAPEEAIRMVEEITRKAPDYVPAWVFLAQAAFAQRKTEDCAAYLTKVLSRDPVNYEAMLLRGNLALTQGDSTNAVICFGRLGAIFDRDPQAQYRLAAAHLMNREIPQATACLTKALSLNSNYVDAILLQAEVNIRVGNSSGAIAALTRLLRQQPQNPRGYAMLANAHLAQNHPEEALQVYRQMAQALPKDPDAPLLLGNLLVRQRRWAEARQAFEKCLELAPTYLTALERIVDVDVADKQYEPALARLRQQMEKNPKAPEPWLLVAKVHLAQAITLMAQASANRPAAAAAEPLRFADVPGTQPEADQAEQALLKAIELDPNVQTAYLLLAQLYVLAGKQQQALARLDALIA